MNQEKEDKNLLDSLHLQVDKKILPHDAEFPHNPESVKKWLNSCLNLSANEKSLIFLITDDVIETLNKTGMNRWYPDKLKPVFPELFAMGLSAGNNKLIKFLRKK